MHEAIFEWIEKESERIRKAKRAPFVQLDKTYPGPGKFGGFGRRPAGRLHRRLRRLSGEELHSPRLKKASTGRPVVSETYPKQDKEKRELERKSKSLVRAVGRSFRGGIFS